MRKNIQNELVIECEDVDFTQASQIEFYVRQEELFFQYTPRVLEANRMAVTVPLKHALLLRPSSVLLQFAFQDANGNSRASEIAQLPVRDFLKETGYDPM